MTTIAAGQQQTLTLDEGKNLNITGAAGTTGVAYLLDLVLGGTNSTQSWAVGAGALAPIGPYDGQRRVLVTCSVGSVNAEVHVASLSPATGGAQADWTGSGLSAILNKPATFPPPAATAGALGGVKTARKYPDGTLAIGPIVANSGIVILGHSYASYQGMSADISATVGGVSSRSYVEWCNSRLRSGGMVGFDVLANFGVPSKTLQEIISQQLASALATPGDGAWLMAGGNNLNSTLSNPDTLPTIMAQFKILIDALSAGKKYVLVDNFSPITGGGAQYRSTLYPMLNVALKNLCATYSNVFVMDHYTPLVDPSSALLAALAAMMQTDNVHPTSYGAATLGFADALLIADKLALTPYYANTSANMLSTFSGTGGTFLNTSGGGTLVGTIPTGWTLELVTGTCTITTQLAGTIGPDAFQISIGGISVATATVRFYPSSGTALAANFTKSSDTLFSEMGISQQQLNGLCRFNFSVEVDNYTWNGLQRASDEVGYFWSTRNLAGKFRTRPLALTTPATMASVLPVVFLQAAVSGFLRVNLFEPGLFKAA